MEKLLKIHNDNLQEFENACIYDESGFVIIKHAILSRNFDALNILYKFIDPDYTNEDDFTALFYIIQYDMKFFKNDIHEYNGEMLTFLFNNTKMIKNYEYCVLLNNAVGRYVIQRNDNYEFEIFYIIKKLIMYGSNPYIWKENEIGKSQLNFVAKCGCIKLVELFLENVDPLFYEHEYEYMSSASHHYDVLELILPHVRNINAIKDGETILQYAQKNNHKKDYREVIELLIMHGAL